MTALKHVEMAKYAKNTSSFYNHFWDVETISESSFGKLPILKKTDILQGYDLFFPDGIEKFKDNSKYIVTHTSGTTGECMNVVWNYTDYKTSLLNLWLKRYKYHEIKPNDRVVYFYSGRYGSNQRFEQVTDYSLGILKRGLSNDYLIEIYQRILNHKPKWMIIQPSIARCILDVQELYDLEPLTSLKYVEISGEYASEALKERIRSFWNCEISSQYGTNEFLSIAYENPEGEMEYDSENVFIEITDDRGRLLKNGEYGHIIVTTLKNNVFPLIRFDTGDIGRIIDLKRNIMELKSGRSEEKIVTVSGIVSGYTFYNAVDQVNHYMPGGIIDFQIVQISLYDIEINLKIDKKYNEESIYSLFIDALDDDCLNGVNISFGLDCFRINPQSGKTNHIICQ